jgi:hypothetical protein
MIKNKEDVTNNVIDLTGPDGNVFSLMGQVKRLARQLNGFDETLKIDPNVIIENMMSGDYENAVDVFDKAFGNYITLLR